MVLGENLEQRVAMAARRLGLEPAEFIINCLERRCAQVLTPQRQLWTNDRRRAEWLVLESKQIYLDCESCDYADGIHYTAQIRVCVAPLLIQRIGKRAGEADGKSSFSKRKESLSNVHECTTQTVCGSWNCERTNEWTPAGTWSFHVIVR